MNSKMHTLCGAYWQQLEKKRGIEKKRGVSVFSPESKTNGFRNWVTTADGGQQNERTKQKIEAKNVVVVL